MRFGMEILAGMFVVGIAGSAVVAAISFAFMTVLMSGVNMFAMAVVMKVVLGWDLNFSIIISSLAVAAYVALGGLRSAIFNEVLQFMLIWGGALLVPILGLIEAGGWSGFKAKLAHNIATGAIVPGDYTHMWRSMGHFTDNPMGIHWTGIVFGLGFATVLTLVVTPAALMGIANLAARRDAWRERRRAKKLPQAALPAE